MTDLSDAIRKLLQEPSLDPKSAVVIEARKVLAAYDAQVQRGLKYKRAGTLPLGWACRGWRRKSEEAAVDGMTPFLTPDGREVFVHNLDVYERIFP